MGCHEISSARAQSNQAGGRAARAVGILVGMLLAATGPGLAKLILVLALTRWVAYARIVRGQVMVERTRDYVQAASVIGAGDLRILVGHVLPNVVPAIIVVATFSVARVIIADMVELGLVEVLNTSAQSGDERDPAFLRRVLSGLQRL